MDWILFEHSDMCVERLQLKKKKKKETCACGNHSYLKGANI